MKVYVYGASLFCEECGESVREQIRRTISHPAAGWINDSFEYPHGPYPDGGGESDIPEHCASGPLCANAIDMNGCKVGAWLENELTEEGVKYVNEAIAEGREIAKMWAEFYKGYCNLKTEE